MAQKETLKHRQAFEDWVALGENRSFRGLAKSSLYTHSTLHRWFRIYNWEERLRERNKKDRELTHVEPRKEESETVREVETLMGRVKSMVDGCFILEDGKLTPTFAIKSVADFVRIVQVQKDLIMLHKDITGEGLDKAKDAGLRKLADTLNIYTQGMTDEQKLNLLSPTAIIEGGPDQGQGPVSDGDFTEVSDDADPEED